jgi:hypothetical protein
MPANTSGTAGETPRSPDLGRSSAALPPSVDLAARPAGAACELAAMAEPAPATSSAIANASMVTASSSRRAGEIVGVVGVGAVVSAGRWVAIGCLHAVAGVALPQKVGGPPASRPSAPRQPPYQVADTREPSGWNLGVTKRALDQSIPSGGNFPGRAERTAGNG